MSKTDNQHKSLEDVYDEKFNIKEYDKVKYSFTSEEIIKLQSLETIAQLGQMAQQMIDKFVQTDPLIRLGIKNSLDTAILYDVPKKEFIVYNPKIWCGVCGTRKGTMTYQGTIFCEDCVKRIPKEEPKIEEPQKESKPKKSKATS